MQRNRTSATMDKCNCHGPAESWTRHVGPDPDPQSWTQTSRTRPVGLVALVRFLPKFKLVPFLNQRNKIVFFWAHHEEKRTKPKRTCMHACRAHPVMSYLTLPTATWSSPWTSGIRCPLICSEFSAWVAATIGKLRTHVNKNTSHACLSSSISRAFLCCWFCVSHIVTVFPPEFVPKGTQGKIRK